MSKGPLILWLLIELGRLSLTSPAPETVRAYLGQTVTLPCKYSSWSRSRNSMCWGKGECPKSKCSEELLHTDGIKVLSRKSPKYDLQGSIWRGNVSLTIFNTNEGDSSMYCCRIEVPGWFNDVKKNIRLQLRRAPATRHSTTRLPTTTTALTTATAVLPTTAMTIPELTTRTRLQTRTTTALTTVTMTYPPATSTFLFEATTVLPTTELSTEGPTLTAESKGWFLQSTSQESTWEMSDSVTFPQTRGKNGHQLRAANDYRSLPGIRAVGVACGVFPSRLDNAGECKNNFDDMQHGREDEDVAFASYAFVSRCLCPTFGVQRPPPGMGSVGAGVVAQSQEFPAAGGKRPGGEEAASGEPGRNLNEARWDTFKWECVELTHEELEPAVSRLNERLTGIRILILMGTGETWLSGVLRPPRITLRHSNDCEEMEVQIHEVGSLQLSWDSNLAAASKPMFLTPALWPFQVYEVP
ncbi:PREDICTED: T-cell immunoglobulin and mucin domain-containing protein 4 [Odobenus rosmarus divergens]